MSDRHDPTNTHADDLPEWEIYLHERLNRIGGAFANAPQRGLEGLLDEVRAQVEATVVGLIVRPPDGSLSVRHKNPATASDAILQSIVADPTIQSGLLRSAKRGDSFIRFEKIAQAHEDWQEALFIRLPPLMFLQQQSHAYICVVDRFHYCGPDETRTIRSARLLVSAVNALFRRLEAHISNLEHIDAELPVGDDELRLLARDKWAGFIIDSGLGSNDDLVVQEWSPWMRLAHIARLHRELLKRKSNDDKTCRELLEPGWTQGLGLRQSIGIDQDVRSGPTALAAVLGWTEYIDMTIEELVARRRRADFGTTLTAQLALVVRAATLEFDPTAQMNERILGCHMLAHIADWPQERRTYWLSEAPSDEELLVALSNIARLVHHIIGGVPIHSKTIQAYIWALSGYAHKVLKLPACFDLQRHLTLAEREEPALHGLRRFYRNHFFHATEVCLFGQFLLELKVGADPLWRKVSDTHPPGSTKNDVMKLWFLAALLHDIGYAVDIAKGTADLFRMLGKADIHRDFIDGFTRTIEEVSDKLAKEGFQNYVSSDNPGADHGVIGARHLEGLTKRIASEDCKVNHDEYEPAIRAIAWHNSKKHPISFANHSLAFLLVLCDTLQEWRRPALPFAAVGSEVGAWLLAPHAQHARPTQQFRTARMAGLIPDGDTFRIAPGNVLSVELEYSDGILKNWQVFALWLSNSYNLQRLDFTGLGFDIDIKFITPNHGRMTNMHALRDLARETHMSFLSGWFPNTPSKDDSDCLTNNHMTYRKTEATEILTLHLSELSRSKPLTRNMSAFREGMKRWSRRDERRDFESDNEYDTLI